MTSFIHKHSGLKVEAFQFTKLTLLKENNYLLPAWLQKKVVYKDLETYVKLPNRAPQKGEARGMLEKRDNPRYEEHRVGDTEWVVNHPNNGLLKFKHNDMVNNYRANI